MNILPTRSVKPPIKPTAAGAPQDNVEKIGSMEARRQVVRERRQLSERRKNRSESSLPYDMRQRADRRQSGRFVATS